MSGIIENESESGYYTADEGDTLSICSNDSVDLYHLHLTRQQEAIQELFRSLGFIDMNDTRILSGNIVAKAFEQSREKIIKIRQETYSLFGFKSRAKGIPNLNATVKLINAISGNWYGYTIKSSRNRKVQKSNEFGNTITGLIISYIEKSALIRNNTRI